MTFDAAHYNQSSPAALAFYQQAVEHLLEADVPFLVGGGYAIHAHTGITRITKDFDIFVMREDIPRALDCLSAAGFRSELTFPHWLAKAYHGDDFIDLIFNSGNGCCPVDEQWFEHAPEANVLGYQLKVSPVEETIWQKAYIMERERFDGADIVHLLLACGETLDWRRLIDRFGDYWRVLLAHIVLFGFAYPGQRSRIPAWVNEELLERLQRDQKDLPEMAGSCRGTVLSREQYLVDLSDGEFRDERLSPTGTMTPLDVAIWTPPRASPH